jgi:hypothetical protein
MYGFPLIIWSAGAAQIHRFGVPGILGILAFAAGALVAMAIAIGVTCRGFSSPLPGRDPSVKARGGVHVVSVLGGIVAGWAVTLPVRSSLAFFLGSLVTVLVFEALLSLELHLAADRNSDGREHLLQPGESTESE